MNQLSPSFSPHLHGLPIFSVSSWFLQEADSKTEFNVQKCLPRRTLKFNTGGRKERKAGFGKRSWVLILTHDNPNNSMDSSDAWGPFRVVLSWIKMARTSNLHWSIIECRPFQERVPPVEAGQLTAAHCSSGSPSRGWQVKAGDNSAPPHNRWSNKSFLKGGSGQHITVSTTVSSGVFLIPTKSQEANMELKFEPPNGFQCRNHNKKRKTVRQEKFFAAKHPEELKSLQPLVPQQWHKDRKVFLL